MKTIELIKLKTKLLKDINEYAVEFQELNSKQFKTKEKNNLEVKINTTTNLVDAISNYLYFIKGVRK